MTQSVIDKHEMMKTVEVVKRAKSEVGSEESFPMSVLEEMKKLKVVKKVEIEIEAKEKVVLEKRIFQRPSSQKRHSTNMFVRQEKSPSTYSSEEMEIEYEYAPVLSEIVERKQEHTPTPKYKKINEEEEDYEVEEENECSQHVSDQTSLKKEI